MVRAPCCEKMGLKKGSWTPEEDQILISYIKLHGHGNWRALPKQAGLLRCGKSCRLRWTNYLRPGIKRGNFTGEEEDTIIRLHEMLGNKWSAIAARLAGRTDNEIKNVWHTRLKKRLKQNHHSRKPPPKQEQEQETKPVNHVMIRSSESIDNPLYRPLLLSPSQQECSSDMSSVDTDHNNSQIINTCKNKMSSSSENIVEIDDNFWSEVLSADNSSIDNNFSAVGTDPLAKEIKPSSTVNDFTSSNTLFESMDYWYNLFTRAGESLELPEI